MQRAIDIEGIEDNAESFGAEMTTMTHCCISLKNILKLYLEGKGGWIEGDDGRVLTESEVYQLVREEKAKGYMYFSGCDSRDTEGRCKGHLLTVKGEGK